jgi:hypothetical protein
MKTLECEHIPQLADPNLGLWHSIDVEGQKIGLRTFLPEILKDENTILIDPIAFSVHASKPRDVQRSSILSEETGLVTVALEMPGMGPGSSELTNAQKNALKQGDWSVLGDAQWDAIREALELQGIVLANKKVHFNGFSMGVSSMIGLIESAPEDVEIGNVIAWEGVAWKPRGKITQYLNIGGLALRMIASGGKLSTYQKKLAPPVPDSLRSALKQESEAKQNYKNKIASWILPVVAMAKGMDAEKLTNALGQRQGEDTVVFIWNGEKSTMSRNRANKFAASVIRLSGVIVHEESDEDGRHGVEDGLYNSIPRIADALAA